MVGQQLVESQREVHWLLRHPEFAGREAGDLLADHAGTARCGKVFAQRLQFHLARSYSLAQFLYAIEGAGQRRRGFRGDEAQHTAQHFGDGRVGRSHP